MIKRNFSSINIIITDFITITAMIIIAINPIFIFSLKVTVVVLKLIPLAVVRVVVVPIFVLLNGDEPQILIT